MDNPGAVVVIGCVILVILLAVLFRGMAIVPPGQCHVVERLGRYQRTLEPGLNRIIPYIDRVVRKLDVRERHTVLSGLAVATRDNQWLTAETTVHYQVADVVTAAYAVTDLDSALQQLAATTLRNIVLGMDLDGVPASSGDIRRRLGRVLHDTAPQWGLVVPHVELRIVRAG